MSVTEYLEMVKFRAWPNVIEVNLVGLADSVASIQRAVGPSMKYRNLNTAALSIILDLRPRSVISARSLDRNKTNTCTIVN
jgi:hypothetical protein